MDFLQKLHLPLTLPYMGGSESPPIISDWITSVRTKIGCSNFLTFQIEHIYVFMSNFKSVPTIRRPPGTEKVKNTPVQVGLSAIWRVASTSVIPWNIPTSEELDILLGLEDILNSRSLPQTSNLDFDCRQGPRQRPKAMVKLQYGSICREGA